MNKPMERERPPFVIIDGVPLRPIEIDVEPRPGDGCGCLLAVIAVVAVALAVLFCGCRTYTVVAADREVVPLAPCEDGKFEVTEEGSTGWYVPDAVMLELLDAE